MKQKIEKLENEPENRAIIGLDGMAEDSKLTTPPTVIHAPKAIAPIMAAFNEKSVKVTKLLIIQAATAIYGEPKWGKTKLFSKTELNGIVALISSIKPKDSLEALFAAQIVVGHLLGMKKLSEGCSGDQKIGLNLLRFSSEAMQMLIKKQAGATQNIIVNYSYNGQGNAVMQTMLPNGGQ